MLAASRIGAAYVNVNPLFKAPQVEYLAGDCDIRVMIGDTPKLEELQPKTVQTAFYKGAKPEGPAARTYLDVAEALGGRRFEGGQERLRIRPGDHPLHLGIHGDAKGRLDEPAQRGRRGPDRLDVPGEHAGRPDTLRSP